MRFLNKIAFINSANIPYAEVQLDGNIHFIGTQGVGKSTVLRAILYFYNVDSRRLGIPTGPTVKTFGDWYLGYANSYIIYEVIRETGPFCIVAFKSQNRVCFRFINTAYDSKYFIDENGDALHNWNAIREGLDADRINISPIVNSYDQYRDILFGNSAGIKGFKKYSLLEAKQYKNIYRTIQNVFLNTKLDADEIKQTIISSMEEEQISIDLDQYKHHLKDFETDLNDIKKFRQPEVLNQAQNATVMLSAIRHLKREQTSLVGQLLYRLETIEQEKPQLFKRVDIQTQELKQQQTELSKENALFDKRKERIQSQISELNGKLKDSAKQKKYYDSINIQELITRVSADKEQRLQLDAFKNEKTLLTNQYSDINNKYDVLIKEQEHQLQAYINQKNNEEIAIERQSNKFVAELNVEYEKLYQTLEAEHEEELHSKELEYRAKQQSVHELEKQKLTIKHTKYYETEIKEAQEIINSATLSKKEDIHNIKSYKQQIENLQNKWKLEDKEAKAKVERTKEKLQSAVDIAIGKRNEIELKIQNSKDSLYGWLNTNKPGWEQTIGKVISEKVLFQDGLSPKLTDHQQSLYGLSIDLTDINLRIKTIDDYKFELEQQSKLIEQHEQDIRNEDSLLVKTLEKVQRRNIQPIKELKEKVRQSEYQNEQNQRQIEAKQLEINQFIENATTDKVSDLEVINTRIDTAKSLLNKAQETLETSKKALRKSKDNKQKEKTRRINEHKAENTKTLEEIKTQLQEKRNKINEQVEKLKKQRNGELNSKGADTKRLSEIEKEITTIENELNYIENNRTKVSDYQKDKRELFDKEKTFKTDIDGLQKKLTKTLKAFEKQQSILSKQINQTEQIISNTNKQLEDISADERKYESFSKGSVYSVYSLHANIAKPTKTSKSAIQVIADITDKYYQSKDKETELKTSIDRFLSHFSENNIFKFPSKLIGSEEYMHWADELNDFIEEGKIDQFEKRTNDRFASIINSVGKETSMLISKTGDIKKITTKINTDFRQKNFVSAINTIELDVTDSKNTAVTLLKRIKEFNDENALTLGQANLFSTANHDTNNQKAIELLKQLVKEINQSKHSVVHLSDSFELSFRIEENGNDTGWVEKLTNVGSEGTDVLVKAMINIMLLNVFKEGASRKFKDFKLHCMMDEIGKLHPNNVKGILKFANDRNILLINGSPTENTPLNYRHIYKISKDENRMSAIKRIVTNPLAVN